MSWDIPARAYSVEEPRANDDCACGKPADEHLRAERTALPAGVA